jgi:serine/threonine protein kinase
MIMEYVGGGVIMSMRDDVPTHTEDGEQLPPQWACVLTGGTMGESLASKLFRQFISAMEFLHLNLVAHR